MSYSPTYMIKIEDKPISDELAMRLLSWEVEDEEKVDKLTLTFNNFDLAIGDDKQLEQGNLIEFRHGYTNGDMSKSKFYTLGQREGWKEIRIEAIEVINMFNTEPKTRYWSDSDLEKVVAQIASDNQLNYETQERTDAKGTKLKFDYFQPNVEDMAFLYTLGRHIGYEVWIEDDKLFFMPRSYWQKPYMKFIYAGDTGNVLDFNPKINTMNRKGKFSGGGIDLEKKQTFNYTENGQTKRAVYLGNKLWDFDKINKRYQKLKEARNIRIPMSNRKEAEDFLAGKWIEETNDQITAELHLIGEPFLTARRVVEVQNVGNFNGNYYVKRVVHSGGNDGYTSVAELTRNSAFDKKGKYTKENIDSQINKDRMTVKEFLKKTKGSTKSKYYQRFFK